MNEPKQYSSDREAIDREHAKRLYRALFTAAINAKEDPDSASQVAWRHVRAEYPDCRLTFSDVNIFRDNP